jgi:hypothetical protein
MILLLAVIAVAVLVVAWLVWAWLHYEPEHEPGVDEQTAMDNAKPLTTAILSIRRKE